MALQNMLILCLKDFVHETMIQQATENNDIGCDIIY